MNLSIAKNLYGTVNVNLALASTMGVDAGVFASVAFEENYLLITKEENLWDENYPVQTEPFYGETCVA